MAFPHNIDFDRLVAHILSDLRYALTGWAGGRPTDETALLNRLTEVLARRRRGCDIGVSSPVLVVPQVAVLHRQGVHQTDRYGSDLAVTLFSPGRRFAKTAFFQLKKTAGNTAQLQREQLDEAAVDNQIGERSFVIAVDEVGLSMRIAKCNALRGAFRVGAVTHIFDTTTWSPLVPWLWRWMSCGEAPSSDLDSIRAVESLIAQFAVPDVPWSGVWGERGRDNLPQEYSPARAWLAFRLEQFQTDEELFEPDEGELRK